MHKKAIFDEIVGASVQASANEVSISHQKENVLEIFVWDSYNLKPACVK